MNYETDCKPRTLSSCHQFSAAFYENLESVIESMQVIQFECDVVGDKFGAGFFRGVVATVRAFASAHAPFGRHNARRSRL